MSLHNQPKAQFRENMEALPRSSREGTDTFVMFFFASLLLDRQPNVDGRSIYERDTGPAEFQKFVFRGHKQRFEESGPKHVCDACNQGIASGSMITAEPFHYHEVP